MVDPNFAGKSGPYQPCRTDLDQMLDTPTHGSHHRRAASETFSRFSDILLDDGVVLEFPPAQPGPSETNRVPAHLRSLSVDTDFFEGLGLGLDGPTPATAARVKHRHSNSMDGYSSATSAEVDSAKRAMPDEKLAELALMDPKRAKRILANRQSAARSKERKIHYTSELEKKVQTLQTEATTLSAQVTLLQRDTTELTNENKELKFKLKAMEQQAHLRDALNDAMRNELQQLKIAAGQVPAVNGNNRGFSTRPPTFPYFNNARLNGQSQPVFQDFNNGV